LPLGISSDLDVPHEGVQHGASCLAVELDGEFSKGRSSSLNTYSPNLVGESGHSDWVIQCAKQIYLIVGISYVSNKLQLLALLIFLEEERQKVVLGALFRSGTKGKREVKNLECSVNYDARGVHSSHGKKKMRGHTVVL